MMLYRFSVLLFMLLIGEGFFFSLDAQSIDTLCWKELSYLKQTSYWLQSENAAGLEQFSGKPMSVAELFFEKQNGAFCNYYQSENSYNWGVETESFYRLNAGIVFYGLVGYHNFQGKAMAGSAFINPENTPFDIVEYAEGNAGRKNLESYHLIGAVSGALSPKWTIGSKFDFTAANYAKEKDLRHQNKLLDFELTAGVLFHWSASVNSGINFYYRKSVEGLLFDTYGTTDKLYTSLISYGAFYGPTEVFGENGYTRHNEEKPLLQETFGLSWQHEYVVNPRLRFFNEVGFKKGKGYYGKQSPYSVVYSNHQSDEWSLQSILSYTSGKNRHQWGVDFHYSKLHNNENIYRTETFSGGLSNVVYYGALETSKKCQWNIESSYVGYLNGTVDTPEWTIKASALYMERDVTASVYPFYRNQMLRIGKLSASVERGWLKEQHGWKALAGIAFQMGNGDVKNDGLYAQPSDSQLSPKSMDTYLYKEYDYLTAKQLNGEIGCKYTTQWMHTPCKYYISLGYEMTKALQTVWIERPIRHELRCSVGCLF